MKTTTKHITKVMTRKAIFFLLLVSGLSSAQDFNLDNKSYQTISWNAFFSKLEKNPKLIYFDIRTKGEQRDTSRYKSYNQGRIRGAIETDFFDFKKNYPVYQKHKNDTIYLYCSHSRRSRLLAKQLADSSFVNVISINGGLSYLNMLSDKQIPLKRKYLATHLNYKLITPAEFITKVKDHKAQLIDVRPDSIYYGKAKSPWENSFGTIQNVQHIPFDKIQDQLKVIHPGKQIILFDNDGELAPVAAKKLFEKGMESSILLFGLENLQNTIPFNKRSFLKSGVSVITVSDLLGWNKKSTVVIDIRSETEYNSNDSIKEKNMGRLKAAVNIPFQSLTREKMEHFKDNKIVLYDAMMGDELYAYAKKLKDFGCKEVYLLAGGIRLLRWHIANTEQKKLETLIEN